MDNMEISRLINYNCDKVQIGIGKGSGENMAIDAIKMAYSCPWNNKKMSHASSIAINIIGDIGLDSVSAVEGFIHSNARDENIEFILNAEYSDEYKDSCEIVLIATDFDDSSGINDSSDNTKKSCGRFVVDDDFEFEFLEVNDNLDVH